MPIVATDFQPIADVAEAICGNPSTLSYVAAVFNIGKVVHDVVCHETGPLTGYQYVKASEANLDNALGILGDDFQGGAIDAKERVAQLKKYDKLKDNWYDLETRTRSYRGSASNRSSGRELYEGTCEFVKEVKHLSKKGIAELTMKKASQQGGQSLVASPPDEEIEDSTSPADHDIADELPEGRPQPAAASSSFHFGNSTRTHTSPHGPRRSNTEPAVPSPSHVGSSQ